ncbi:MAG: type II CRISPR RNA-guided endonuclease Cas9 [Bacteroidetes bacterium]|nr:type II CRISPR RNA-guided endonuclease Cas9 [Bacteroidota bacterium]
MKKILGLDLGVSSIGWALIEEDGSKRTILGMGSRIIPLSTDDKNEFSRGNAITKNQKRTVKRTIRKGYDRYQLRKSYLKDYLNKIGMMPDASLFNISALELYGLRDAAVNQKISLQEIGRIRFHLNQKRGYKSSRLDKSEDKKETEYVQKLVDRFQIIKDSNITVGQFFFKGLQADEHFRIKEQVFPREAYMQEFDLIWKTQNKFYPDIINDVNKEEIRNRIIYYQRPLKSQKGLVSICEFEGAFYKKEDKEIFGGPKVAPRSSPLFQVCKIWESINNIQIRDRKGDKFEISIDQKQKLFEYLDANERLTETALYKILGISKNDGFYGNQMTEKGIQGNLTKTAFKKIFGDEKELSKYLEFNLEEEEYENIDKNTGEVSIRLRIKPDFENKELYKLWHLVYSIKDEESLAKNLKSMYNFSDEIIKEIIKLDFSKSSFSNKSSRAIRKILPYLQRGLGYSSACEMSGYNHSNSLTKSENIARRLLEKLPLLKKNSLRQPIVETILNQMINVVNAIDEKYGKPDEIRVELARELKQSREERNKATININKRERENKNIESILSELNLKTNRKSIEKFRLYKEINNEESKLNATCIYCNQALSFASSINGNGVEVEHIIPRSRLFDDSFQNKTLVHTHCNLAKGNMTAFDFMQSKSEKDFNEYLDRVEMLFKNKIISKAKRDKLLTSADKIPQDFIARQLRETQYVAKKAREILLQYCHHVNATSGGVTDYLRHQWGWNDVLMNLQLERYRTVGQTEFIDVSENDVIKKKEVINNWTKRNDHRHHAVDALTVACTSQGIIQRLNTLNKYVQRIENETKTDSLKSEQTLKTFVQNERPFTTREVETEVDKILVSFKSGKKVATKGRRLIKKGGKNIIAQSDIIVPRGALSEESIYGKIKLIERNVPLRKLFETPDAILKRYIKAKVNDRIKEHNNDTKKAFSSTKKTLSI